MKTTYYCSTNPTSCKPKTYDTQPTTTPACCGKPMTTNWTPNKTTNPSTKKTSSCCCGPTPTN